jgi:hypothetical protein
VQYQDFDAKLRMTASVLGCTSRKELVARFHAANKASQCDLDRLHKWLQGRALPRSAEVLQDWAKVLGSKRGGDWLASCSLDDFARELATLFGRDAEHLLTSQAFAGRGTRTAQPASAAEPRISGVRYLCGAYACYSAAWSPYARGKWIRSSLVIAPGRGASLLATYSEMLMGKPVRLSGTPNIARRSIHMSLTEPGGEIPLFFALFLPRPPAGVLTGMISGVTFLAPEPEPSAGRIVMVRVPKQDSLDASNRYLVPEPGVVAADLADLGLDPASPARVDRLVNGFLVKNGNLDQVDMAVQAALAAEFDPWHVGAEEQASSSQRVTQTPPRLVFPRRQR